MSDRLDRAEALLEAHGNAMADLATKQEITQRQIDSLVVAVERTNAIVVELANVVYQTANRQEDHEHRITRLEDRL